MADLTASLQAILELKRIALELETFPYSAGSARRVYHGKGNVIGGKFSVENERMGCPVYYEILTELDAGRRAQTRQELRWRIDRYLYHGTLCPTAAAALKIANRRRDTPQLVSPPWLPIVAANYYFVRSNWAEDTTQLSIAAKHGLWVADGLRRHTKRPYGARGEQMMYERARTAARAALNSKPWPNDVSAWVDEQDRVRSLMIALGTAVSIIQPSAAGATRLITLDED